MSLQTTEQLQAALAGRYLIERHIGEGGMATVYLARDLKHDRHVALKVLKPELGAVLGVERFLSEIKVTANLQHPNLLPLFDSGEANGLLFYVMPFVEGESLRARLDREQQLSIEEAVRIASAVASALAYAHERGVIHRDLKPENILMQSGQPVVADFGIALAVSNAGGARVTQTGLSLGTPQYMSPEQATGDRTIDARSDLYSLAAMTYEMIAGEPPHSGPNAQAIMAKLLTAEPAPLSTLRTSAPVHVELAIAKALAKVPADRFANATEFANALTGHSPIAGLTGATRANTAARAAGAKGVGKREWFAWGMATVAVTAAVGATLWPRSGPEVEPPVRRLTISIPDTVFANGTPMAASTSVAISPGGDLIAWIGTNEAQLRELYVRRSDELTARVLPGVGAGAELRFSPDGRLIYFRDPQGKLVRIAVDGGTPVPVADSVRFYSIADDGTIYFAGPERSLWALDAGRGSPRLVARADSAAGFRNIYRVDVCPGSAIAMASVSLQYAVVSAVLARVDLRSGHVLPLSEGAFNVHCVDQELVVVGRQGGVPTIEAIRLDPSGAVLGRLDVPLAQDVASLNSAGVDFAVAKDGTSIYRRRQTNRLLATAVAIQQGTRRSVLRSDGQRYDEPAVSPDGRRVVLRVGGSAFNTGELWLLEVGSGTFTPLTRGGNAFRPTWSRDGSHVYYFTGTATDQYQVRAKPWDGSGGDSLHLKAPNIAEFAEGPRGGWSVLRTYGLRDILIVPADSLTTATPRAIVSGPANETNPRISPSGQLLAYQSDESGTRQVFVRPLPGPGPRVPVSIDGGSVPRWSRDGSRIFYRAKGTLMAATITEQPELAISRRDVVLSEFGNESEDLAEWIYDEMPNGAILTTLPVGNVKPEPWELVVLTNWQQLFKRRPAGPVSP